MEADVEVKIHRLSFNEATIALNTVLWFLFHEANRICLLDSFKKVAAFISKC